jgi:predicted nuclease of predicted toxin-antitoxin system
MLRAELADLLRVAGHDVVRAEEIGQARADDLQILNRATEEKRILLTLDGHFGDWVVLPLSEHHGVLRVKAHPPSTKAIAKILLPLLSRHEQNDFQNHLVILSANRTRWIRTTP